MQERGGDKDMKRAVMNAMGKERVREEKADKQAAVRAATMQQAARGGSGGGAASVARREV